MSEKPILFSTPMVQAILEGRKTQTRRVINPQPCREATEFVKFIHSEDCGWEARFGNKASRGVCDRKPPVFDGDILWVREKWRLVDFEYVDDDWNASVQFKDDTIGSRLHYLKNGADERTGWRPSIHMPRAAARKFLRVTNVRVERVQDISIEDVWREGIDVGDVPPEPDPRAMLPNWDSLSTDAQDGYIAMWARSHYFKFLDKVQKANRAYIKLWNELNEKHEYGWNMNPWVWVYEFERCSQSNDVLLHQPGDIVRGGAI